MFICSTCWSCMAPGSIKCSTVDPFVKISVPSCCSCDTASGRANIRCYCGGENFVNMHFFLASLPVWQLPRVPSTPQGAHVIMAMWDNFIWNTSLLSRPVAVKSPFMPNPTSGAPSPLPGSGTEGWKALGEAEDCSSGRSCISSVFSLQSVCRVWGHD